MSNIELSRRHRLFLWLARIYLTLRHPFLMVRHRGKIGFWADPALPRQHTEKMLWRKMLDRNPLFVEVTDKLQGRDYVLRHLPSIPMPAIIWIGQSALDIPDEVMTGPAIIKTTNGSGNNFVVRDGEPGREHMQKHIARLLVPGGARRREEWAYGHVPGQLVAEELLPLGGGDLPTDLKVFAAGGRACAVWATDKINGRSLTLAPDGTPLDGRDELYPDEADAIPFSEELAALTREASERAEVLAQEFDMVRVDFLVMPGRLLGGELTIYSGGGYDTWTNPAIAASIADAWDLRRSWFLRTRHRGPARLYADALIAAETLRLEGSINKAS